MTKKTILLSLLFYGVNLLVVLVMFLEAVWGNYYLSYYLSFKAIIILSAVFPTAVHIFTFERVKKTAGGNVNTFFIQAGGIFIFIIPVLCFTLSPALLEIGHAVYKQIKEELILPNFSEETICNVRDIYRDFPFIAFLAFCFYAVVTAITTAMCGGFQAIKYKLSERGR